MFSDVSLLIDQISQPTRSSDGASPSIHSCSDWVLGGTRHRCFLVFLFVATAIRIAVRVTAFILALVLARAELHEIHSSSARLAEAGGGALPHEGLAQIDLANDVVDLGVTALVAIVDFRPRTIQCSERHFSDTLDIDGVRQFGSRKPLTRIVAAAVVLLEVDVDRDTVVAFSHNWFIHHAPIYPFVVLEHGLPSIEEELDRILDNRRCRARTQLGFRLLHLLHLERGVNRTEDGAGVGEASRAADKSGRHSWLRVGEQVCSRLVQ
ncbi:hypothetical protein EB001_13285 [bacterium]|nr:hypothetical protein [bacterium]